MIKTFVEQGAFMQSVASAMDERITSWQKENNASILGFQMSVVMKDTTFVYTVTLNYTQPRFIGQFDKT